MKTIKPVKRKAGHHPAKWRWVLPALFVVLMAAPLAAAESPLTLEQCLDMAAAGNPDIVRAEKGEEETAYRLKKAEAGYFPEMGVSASAGYISQVNQTRPDDVTVTLTPGQPPITIPGRAIEIGDEQNRDLSLALWQPLYAGGSIKNNVRMSEAALSAAVSQTALQKSDIRKRVTTAFYELAMAVESKKIAEAAKNQIDSHLQDARNLLAQGMIIKNDLYPIEIRRLETEQQIIQTEDAIAKTRAALAEIMGLSPDTPVDIAVDWKNPPPWPVPEDLTAAPPERQEQKIARQQVEMAAAEEAIAGGARLPRVGLTASTHYGWPGFKGNEPDWDTWWQAGVNLTWNVFDMGRRGNEQKAARTKKTRLEKDREAIDRRVALDRLNARLTYEEACRRRIIGEEKVLAARENYRTREDNYRVGTATGSDYLDAHTELMTAEIDLSITCARVRIAWADYMRALGIE
ncbi:MAG: TolC family protein [Thermodesulfobacteriota bacterium]